MNDTPTDHQQAVALFRYGLIADLLLLPPGTQGLYARIQAKAERDYVIPGTTRTRVAPETLRDWLKRYRKGGFDALLPKPRADRGRPRALPAAVVDALLGIKEGNPALSVQLVIREARALPDGRYTIGIRPHHVRPSESGGQPVAMEGEVLVTEISGSESVIHFRLADRVWVSQSHGIHAIEVGEHARLFADVGKALLFGADDRLVAG